MHIRAPKQCIVVSRMADTQIINPPTIGGEEWKLVAPRSQVHIVDRSTMKLVKTIPVNYTNLEPFDIYPEIAGKRYIAIIEPQGNKQRYIVNAFNQNQLDIFKINQRYGFNKGKFIVNDFIIGFDEQLVSFERITAYATSVEYQIGTGGNQSCTHTIQDDSDPIVTLLRSILAFGELRFVDLEHVIYRTRNLNDSRYDIALNQNLTNDTTPFKLITALTPTLNTIAELERLQHIVSGDSVGWSDLSQALYDMAMPNLAAMALITRLHYEQDLDKLPAKPSEKVLANIRTDKVLGQYLSKSLARKAYRIVRRLRINYLKV